MNALVKIILIEHVRQFHHIDVKKRKASKNPRTCSWIGWLAVISASFNQATLFTLSLTSDFGRRPLPSWTLSFGSTQWQFPNLLFLWLLSLLIATIAAACSSCNLFDSPKTMLHFQEPSHATIRTRPGIRNRQSDIFVIVFFFPYFSNVFLPDDGQLPNKLRFDGDQFLRL